MNLPTRQEQKLPDCWDLKPLYTDDKSWDDDFKKVTSSQKAPFWPELNRFRGHLGESVEIVIEAFEILFSIQRKLEKLFVYAHLKHDEEITEEGSKGRFAKIFSLYQQFGDERSWFEPELLALPQEKLKSYLNDKRLGDYRFPLEVIVHLKPHILDAQGEALLAKSEEALTTSYRAFKALTDADVVFPDVKDKDNKSHPLSHGAYTFYLRSSDRTLRKETFTTFHETFSKYKNTLAELYQGVVKNHHFQAKARGYESCMQAALFPRNIPTAVYTALISSVREGIDVHHRYIDLRAKVLGLDKFHLYDSYAPLIDGVDIEIPYQEAVDLVIASVAPLGKDYQETLAKGLTEERWVDRYENKHKRSGAYSSGCYDSPPYILMNYKGSYKDLFTLAHEAGHSMHSYLSKNRQPYPLADYPIFLAEVASTFNEELLFQHLLKSTKDEKKRIFLLTQKLDDIRATFFRQTMFAEFELKTHQLLEEQTPLTPELLNNLYRDLTQFYFGPTLAFDGHAEAEWSRIPHFYTNFYVYQYATGISAALLLASRVMKGGEKERDSYLNFLSLGGSNYPINLLKEAGVDMTQGEAVKSTLNLFSSLTKEMELAFKK
jgi:oligoendopeptidase F